MVGQDNLQWFPLPQSILWFLRISSVLAIRELVSVYLFLCLSLSSFQQMETNQMFHVALNPATGEVLDGLDWVLLLSVMETCWLQLTALRTRRSNAVSDRLRKIKQSSPYFVARIFFPRKYESEMWWTGPRKLNLIRFWSCLWMARKNVKRIFGQISFYFAS